MSDWKYIMFEVKDRHGDPRRVPIIFPGDLIHQDIARSTQHLMFALGDARLVSAGHIPALQVPATEGKSETLNIGSVDTDASVINCYPYDRGRPDGIMPEQMVSLRFIELLMAKLRE